MDSNETTHAPKDSSSSSGQGFNVENIVDQLFRAFTTPKNLYAIGATALIPLLKKSGRVASRHPVVTAGLIGTAVLGYFLLGKENQPVNRTLH